MADKYIIVQAQNLSGLQNQINLKLAEGYQPLSGTFAQVNAMFYQGMANLTGTPVSFGNVTGISDLFRQMSTVNDKEALRMMVGSLFLGFNADNAKPGNWNPSPGDIQNISDTVRTLLNANTPAGVRTIIGAGSSNLSLGSGNDQAKAGDWKPATSDISDVTLLAVQNLLKSTGTVLSAADRTVLKSLLGFGQSDLTIGTTAQTAKSGDYRPAVADISDVTSASVQSLLRYNGTALSAAVQLALRNIIGAGTSSLTTGTTADTAKPGNYAPSVEEIGNASDLGKSVIKAGTISALLQVITGNTPQTNAFLRGDGTWQVPTGTTYGNATTTSAGLMSATDKQRIDNIAAPAYAAVAAGGRPMDTAFMIDSARHADVTYSFSATLSATISTNQNVQVDCQVDGVTVARLAIGITLTLAVTVGMTFPFTHSATFRVPAGKQVKFVKTGTAAVAVSVAAGQEVLL